MNPEEDTLLIVPTVPPGRPGAGVDPPPDPNPPAGLLLAAGAAEALLEVAVTIPSGTARDRDSRSCGRDDPELLENIS